MRGRLLLVLVFATPFLARSTDFAAGRPTSSPSLHVHSELQAAGASASGRRPAVLVADGAVAPNSIPDSIASRMFIRSLADPRRSAPVSARLQLTPADRASLATALADTPVRLAAIAAQRQQVASTAPNQGEDSARRTALGALKSQEDQLVDATYSRILTTVTPQASARIVEYVRTDVKHRIKLFNMGPH
jgi:hypothetical protein